MVDLNWLLRFKTKTSILTATTILISLSISASTANNISFESLKKNKINLEYKFSNGGMSKKITHPSYLANKTTEIKPIVIQNNIFIANELDLLDAKKLFWQKSEDINFQRIFENKIFLNDVSDRELPLVEVERAKFDKIRAGFTSRKGNKLTSDEMSISKRTSPAKQKLQATKTPLINPIIVSFPVFPSSLYRSAFYAHEKCCTHVVQFSEFNWIDEKKVSLTSLINEKSNSNWLTNPKIDNIPTLIDTPIILIADIEKELTIPEIISFVPNKPEIADSKPSPTDPPKFDRGKESENSDTGTGSTEITNSNPTKVPEPVSISLFSLGLMGMFMSRYRHPNV